MRETVFRIGSAGGGVGGFVRGWCVLDVDNRSDEEAVREMETVHPPRPFCVFS